MGRMRWLASALVAVLAMVGLTACGGGGGDDDELPGQITATEMFRFEPDELTVRFNRETILALRNEDDRPHNFTLTHVFTDPDNFVSVDAQPRQTADIKFTVTERPRDGFLTFYCRFHQHEGMSGRIRLT